jgi:hypothetical protein
MTTTILSYGMGVESTALLLRWVLEPDTRPCPLADLIVVSAQVGDEFSDTGRDVETHILPLMRAHGIRYVQVARHGHLEADGITVLSDTRQPSTVYLNGDYRLSDELRRNGTVPQFAGVHRCALKFKAFVIEKWLTDNVRGEATHAIGYNAQERGRVETSEYAFKQRATHTARVAFGFNADETNRVERANEYDGLRGAPQVPDGEAIAFGFNADETLRIGRNTEYNTLTRTAFYPLMVWNWTRQDCINYIERAIGVIWRKSCCVYCPFAHNKQNSADLLARHAEHPEQVADAMMLEHASLSLNPRGTLYKAQSLIAITAAAGNTVAVAAYQSALVATPWALYRVRRIYHAARNNPAKKGQADRAVELLALIEPTLARPILDRLAARLNSPIHEQHGIAYVYQDLGAHQE